MQHTKTDRVALVAGASGELGRAFCDVLVRDGYQVIAADVRPFRATGDDAQQACGNHRIRPQILDVRMEDSWQDALRKWQPVFPQLHLLVNAAGVLSAGQFANLSSAAWTEDIDVNLRGTIMGCHACSRWLLSGDQRSGIINISSCASFLPLPWSSVYNATKAGVLAFSESLAEEWRDINCRITAACPGFFASDLYALDAITDPHLAGMLSRITSRSTLTAADVAVAVWKGHQAGKSLVLSPRQLIWWHRWKRWFPRFTNHLVGRRARLRYERIRGKTDPGFS